MKTNKQTKQRLSGYTAFRISFFPSFFLGGGGEGGGGEGRGRRQTRCIMGDVQMTSMQECYPFIFPLIPSPDERELKEFFCLFHIWNTTIAH